MPFQQVNLDQSIYKKGQAAYSQALRPSNKTIVNPSQGWTGLPGFSDEAKAIYEQNSFVDKQKAEWAAQDKATKQQREQQSSQLQNIGMQTVQQQQQQKQQVQQQQVAQRQQIESNPEPAAKEMYELMKTLPDEAKQQLLQQIFTPTSTGGSISSGGKEVKMGAKYNPIANVFLEKGWAMFDPKGNVNLSEPEPTYEKGTFEIKEAGGNVYKLNSQTGKSEVVFIPESAYFSTEKAAIDGTQDFDGLEKKPVMVEKNKWKVEYTKKTTEGQTPEQEMEKWNTQQFGSFKRNILSGVNDLGFMIDPELRDQYLSMTYEEYMQFMQGETPSRFAKNVDIGGGKTTTSNNIFDKILGKIGLSRNKPSGGTVGNGTTNPAFNETNVSELVKMLPATLTSAQRADLIKQGATDVDINEALKRKWGGK